MLIAVSFWNQRRYDDVIVWVNKALDRDPRHLFARELLTGAYWMTGEFERGLGEDLKRAKLRAPDEETLSVIKRMIAEAVHTYRRGGLVEANRLIVEYRQRAAELLSDGTARAERGNAGAGLVVHYALAGNLDAAFEHLHRLLDARDPVLVHLAVAPQWDSLRADPRFNECLVRMKLRSA